MSTARARQLEYTRAREAAHLQWIQEQDRNVNEEIQQLMLSTLDTLKTEAQAWLTRYATSNGISLSEASKTAAEADMEALARKAKVYVENKDFSARANAKMKLYNFTMRMSRHELLIRRMELETIATFDEVDGLIRNHLEYIGETELFRQAQILGLGVADKTEYERVANNIVNSSFHSATFSDRVWANHDVLNQALGDGIKKSIMMGRHPTAWMNAMEAALDESMAGSSYALKRLAVTESARVQIEAQKASYEEGGYDEFEVICEPTACPICTPFDGLTEKVEKMRPGDNAPPFHPNCKCATAAYVEPLKFEEDETLGYNNYRNENSAQEGEHASIPPSMEGNFDDFSPLELAPNEKESFFSLFSRTKETGHEYGEILTPSGKVYSFGNELADGVYMPISNIREFGLKLYHSHTNDTLPSTADFQRLLDEKISEIGVITRNGDIYKAYVGEGWIPSDEEFYEAERRIRTEVDYEIVDNPNFFEWNTQERVYMAIREQAYRLTREFEWTLEGGKLDDQ